MISPVAPAMILTLGMTYLMVMTPPDADDGMAAALSDNMIRHHDRHISSVVQDIVPAIGPGLNGVEAIELSFTMTAPFMDMGEWRGYAFSNGADVIVVTFTEPDADSRFPAEQYTRAASLVNQSMQNSNRDIHAGPLSFDSASGRVTIGENSYDVSGASFAEGAMAVVSVYDDVAG
jgi:hypothetical protein